MKTRSSSVSLCQNKEPENESEMMSKLSQPFKSVNELLTFYERYRSLFDSMKSYQYLLNKIIFLSKREFKQVKTKQQEVIDK